MKMKKVYLEAGWWFAHTLFNLNVFWGKILNPILSQMLWYQVCERLKLLSEQIDCLWEPLMVVSMVASLYEWE